MSELEPCPFCGGEASVKVLEYDDDCKVWGVFCELDLESEYSHGHFVDNYPTEAEAIAAWNSRATCGTLTAEQVRETVEKHWHDLPDEYDMPEATALPEYSYDWQAIADELNDVWNSRADYHGFEQAAIEAWESVKAWNSRAERTCAMIPSFTKPATLDDCQEFCCSACGEYMVLQQFQGCADDVPNYCPYCGARRVGE